MRVYHLLVVGGVLFVITSLVLGVGAQEPPSEDPLGEPPTFLQEFYDAWVTSPHAQADAEAFVHWDAEGEVPDTCAKCHSTPGYRDYLGADGSAFGAVDAAAPIGSVINCDACHNSVASSLTAVTFPSGVEVTNLNDSARCMVCHQGRASVNSVNEAIATAGMGEDLNAVSTDLTFINIHYYAAAASLYGSEVHGGYEFDGNRYQMRFTHTEGVDTCIDCHSPHTLEVQVSTCTTCHEDVETLDDVRDIRMNGSLIDYDGDGDMDEGIAGELETLQEILYQTIQAYAAEVAGTPIVYDVHTHPYFFIDTNANGETDEDEVNRENAYNAFTGLLLQATYNYQVTLKDPGAFAHNAKYHIELLYDSIQMLNNELAQAADISELNRDDPGHFNSTGEPFRHWDAEGEVPGTCTKCHTAEGLPFFLKNGVTIAAEPANSLSCSTCHDNIGEFTLYTVDEVTMPSGAVVSFGEGEEANLCLNCHQGRESTVSVDRAIASANVGPDEVSEALRFRNPHYFAAGATLFGGEAQGAYQFEGMEYNGRFEHERRFDTCEGCHNEHSLTIRSGLCQDCHEAVEEPEDIFLIRQEPDDVDAVDYDGDGDDKEPIRDEIATFHNELLAVIKNYTLENLGAAVAYNAASYPYWFIDTNGNGEVDPEEGNADNQWAQWTPNLLRAAYNYQYVAKDPGAFAHNSDYILQVLYDSLQALGGDDAVANYTRPPLRVDD